MASTGLLPLPSSAFASGEGSTFGQLKYLPSCCTRGFLTSANLESNYHHPLGHPPKRLVEGFEWSAPLVVSPLVEPAGHRLDCKRLCTLRKQSSGGILQTRRGSFEIHKVGELTDQRINCEICRGNPLQRSELSRKVAIFRRQKQSRDIQTQHYVCEIKQVLPVEFLWGSIYESTLDVNWGISWHYSWGTKIFHISYVSLSYTYSIRGWIKK